MNKIFFVILVVILLQPTYASVDYNKIDTDRKACYKVMTSQCFYDLMNKYSSADKRTKNFLRYDYAVGLMAEQNYAKARENFKSVLFHETNDKHLIQLANNKIKELNEINRKIITANNLDSGDYFNKNTKKSLWLNHYNIKIYIASNVGKENIIKSAFRVWDEKMFKTINFSYVDSADDADIIIKFVDSLSGNAAGITKYSEVIQNNNKNYLKKINVEIALNNPSGGKYTDSNLMGIILHEIGHALGINYHSDNQNDIMYYSTESYKNGSISRRDIRTLEMIYR